MGDKLSGIFYIDHLIDFKNREGRYTGHMNKFLLCANTYINYNSRMFKNRRKRDTPKVKKVNYLINQNSLRYNADFFRNNKFNSNDFTEEMMRVISQNFSSM